MGVRKMAKKKTTRKKSTREKIEITCSKCGHKFKKLSVVREDGFLYFLDKAGDLCRVQMNRGGKRGKK